LYRDLEPESGEAGGDDEVIDAEDADILLLALTFAVTSSGGVEGICKTGKTGRAFKIRF